MKSTRARWALALALIAGFLMAPRSMWHAGSIYFGTTVSDTLQARWDNTCSHLFLVGTGALSTTSGVLSSLTFKPMLYPEINKTEEVDAAGDWVPGTSTTWSWCYQPADALPAEIICRLTTAIGSDNHIFSYLAAGRHVGGVPLVNGDNVSYGRTAGGAGHGGIQFPRTVMAKWTLADGDCVGGMVAGFGGTTASVSSWGFEMECKEVSTAAAPCHP